MKSYPKLLIIVGCLFLVILQGGCSSSRGHSQVYSERVERSENVGGPEEYASAERKVVTTSQSEENEEGHGLFHIIGDIILLPFRAVGALFSAVF